MAASTLARKVVNLPNGLTLCRILLVPLMAVLLTPDYVAPNLGGKLAALLVAMAGATDLLDGYLARRWNMETLLGKLLDPVADKLLVTVGLVMLLRLDRLPVWLVLLLLSREFLITGLRSVAVGEGIIIPAGQSGKIKLTLQLVGLGLVMWQDGFLGAPILTLGLWVLYLALFLSLASGLGYITDFVRAIQSRSADLPASREAGRR